MKGWAPNGRDLVDWPGTPGYVPGERRESCERLFQDDNERLWEERIAQKRLYKRLYMRAWRQRRRLEAERQAAGTVA